MLSIFLSDLEHNLISVVIDLLPQAHHEVGVRVSTIVPRGELEGIDDVHMDNAFGLFTKEIIERYYKIIKGRRLSY